ncbi:hypothetical protein SNR37_003392 [Agarivorans aestuarii]|uniref:Uncharacterized protein n=1 Tax=Agarivorans aestuarii TaxID=1563703 RepID=A0ABU7G3T1_9ALTE|nr:hypothetical protein [Agarivorans aestuarii]MEE1673965.1 hypothetical protein [Agarivorans aestuarii]
MSSNSCFPLMISREHFMPQRFARIKGEGMVFIASLRAAEKAGGVWLAFQDSDGNSAVQANDLVSFAQVSHIDWLSKAQIEVEFKILHWGKVTSNEPGFCSNWVSPTLCANKIDLWPDCSKQKNTAALQNALANINLQYPELQTANFEQSVQSDQVKTLCWRWLELLPLPICTKQRLLKSPSASLCIRYLGFILRQSDRFTHLAR